jgi:hypothetical protein
VRATFDVVHLHRIGNCEGRLSVSETGITFDVDNKAHDDEFTLKHGEFVQGLENKTLTIRSAQKDYRFTVPGKASDKAAQSQIARIVDAIVRSRPVR